ncbi:MAG: AbrB/MazE/SpoVT family DNA-binding domain-containing protein [Nitrososphaeria archaeon]|nr:AbrB/MazE/SpoVT family DNA-binding domain-containing protein [Nitrososphaeria archaeon]
MEVVKVDKKGRIMIPKHIREKVNVKEDNYVKIRVDEKSIIIEPFEPVADKYFAVFKISKWPEDLDDFVNEVIGKWWTQNAM